MDILAQITPSCTRRGRTEPCGCWGCKETRAWHPLAPSWVHLPSPGQVKDTGDMVVASLVLALSLLCCGVGGFWKSCCGLGFYVPLVPGRGNPEDFILGNPAAFAACTDCWEDESRWFRPHFSVRATLEVGRWSAHVTKARTYTPVLACPLVTGARIILDFLQQRGASGLGGV